MRYVLVVTAACASAPVPSKPLPTPAPRVAAPLAFRQLHVIAGHARRTSFELTFEGDRATLVETEARATDADGPWQTVSTRAYRGSRRGSELQLTADDMQPLALHCESRSIRVAAATATLVATACGSAATWDPPARTVELDAFACTAAGQSEADTDDDDRLVFAPVPGIEWLEVDADCVRGAGLRLASRRL
jgi:hypothetical protein